MLPYKVLKVSEVDLFPASGRVEKGIQVTFTVGEHGPFNEQFTRAEFSDGTVTQRLTAFANNLTMIAGS